MPSGPENPLSLAGGMSGARRSKSILFPLGLLLGALSALAADGPKLDPANLGTPFQRYTTRDALDRTITFYLSVAPREQSQAKRPVVLFITGSGCQSLWRNGGEHVLGGVQMLLWDEAKGRVRVLIVEKPGVKFLDVAPAPGTAKGASEEYLREHTLPRWAEANIAAVRAVWTLPNVDATRTLVVGHSEGGIVAARVAAELPGVTHVASLAVEGTGLSRAGPAGHHHPRRGPRRRGGGITGARPGRDGRAFGGRRPRLSAPGRSARPAQSDAGLAGSCPGVVFG